ncbi:MAG TPA: 6-bladed beta-propeller, partial [Syntrophomonadaceae bacterium]|nr:6-bladed beta-propeller [Syntrophomonadaceae bacterium]
ANGYADASASQTMGIAALTGVWDGSIDVSWYNTTDTSFNISTPGQLAGLAAIVNGTASGVAQDNFAGKNITLSSDIQLDSSTKYTASYGRFGTTSFAMEGTWYAVNSDARIWTPIGSGVATGNSSFSSTNYFSGTFDGAGHTVSGLYTSIDATVQGLFGCLGQSSVVKNLTVSGCVCGKFVVGGIAAYLNCGTVQNCKNDAIVYADGGEKAGSGLENGPSKVGAVGGIVGSMSGSAAYPGQIIGCTNFKPVTCTNTNQGGRTGGILGIVDKATDYGLIKNCLNFGIVDGYQYSGGIASLIISTNVPIFNCGNTGQVSGHSSGTCMVGGIVSSTQSTVTNCYNTGDYRSAINGNNGNLASNYGGIAGNDGTSGISRLTNCYNTGTFLMSGNTTSGSTVGIICGVTQNSGDIVNCYYLDTAVGTYNTNDISRGYISTSNARSAAAMRAAPFLTEINGDGRTFVADTNNINNGFPILRCQVGDTATVSSVTKDSDPAKLSYVAGQTFNPSGLVLWANYSDGTREQITSYTISKTTALVATDTTITISGTYGGITYSYDFNITMAANALASLAITTKPTNLLYATGDTFNPTGMVVKATYTNGTTATLAASDYSFSPAVALTAADTKITVSYTYAGVTKAADQAITVLASTAPAKNSDNVYELYTADDMLWFANQVNTGTNNAISGKLMKDIDLTGATWTPIGNSSARTYSGTFDGNGKTVTLAINTSSSYTGLFGCLQGAAVKNLTVAGTITGVMYTGSIAGYAQGATVIQDCINNAALSSSSQYLGGITGYAADSTAITACTNNGTIASTSNCTGGIAGYTTGTAAVTGCINNGAVSAAYNVGGIVGSDYSTGAISKCANTGAVTATSTSTSSSYSMGGIVGYANPATTIDQCSNTGSVTGGVMSIGGVVGYLYNASGIVTNDYNTGSVTSTSVSATAHTGGVVGYTNNAASTVQNCYNAGAVSGNTTSPYTAGVIGYAKGNSNVTNNYYLNTTASTGLGYAVDNTVSKTSDELKALAPTLGQYYRPGSVYPILSWQYTNPTPGPETLNFSYYTPTGNLLAFKGATDSVVDSNGNVYVSDYYNNRIVKFDASGNFLAAYGTQGSGVGQFLKPSGIAIDGSGSIYVADTYNNRIVKFNDLNNNGGLEADEWKAWGTAGSGALQFKLPMGVFVKNGLVYTADSYNHRLTVFDSSNPDGTWQSIGAQGSGNGQFKAPNDIVVDSQGNIWVSDTLNNRVQKLDKNGSYIQQYAASMPYGISIDQSGAVYVAERQTGLIQCLTNSKTFGGKGTGAGLFTNPVGLNVDSQNRLWIVDVTTGKVQCSNI